jgi:hypothetical protein
MFSMFGGAPEARPKTTNQEAVDIIEMNNMRTPTGLRTDG